MQAATTEIKREVHESCFELLCLEMVDYVVRTSDHSCDAIYAKLERMGFRVGQRLAERYTKDKQRFQDTLEIIKFICKEFWTEIFKKQIDNLRTNHRGVYVLQDNKFRPLIHLSTSSGTTKEIAPNYVVFSCGMVRGAMANLGISCVVSADIPSVPCCTFTIKIKT